MHTSLLICTLDITLSVSEGMTYYNQGTTELPVYPGASWLAGAQYGQQASGGEGRVEMSSLTGASTGDTLRADGKKDEKSPRLLVGTLRH